MTFPRLYLVAAPRPRRFLDAALRGGVDILQLRAKDADDDEVLAAAAGFRAAARAAGVPFLVNDRPDLAVAAGADGVHVGQEDVAVDRARDAVGPDRLVGLSTHTPEQVDAAHDLPVDYIACGPVHETPTKPGRPAAGLALVRYAAAHARLPWFAIGGLDAATLPEAVRAGARRAVVVRAIADAPDPEAAARELRAALEVPVGAA